MLKTKNCKVVLERLEGESLKKCLQKYGLKLSSENDCKKRPLQQKCHSKTEKPKKRNRRRKKNSELFVPRKNRRKRIKPLDYTDSENEENLKVQQNATVDDHIEPEVLLKDSDSFLQKSSAMTSIKTELEVLRHENLTTEKSSLENGNKSERKMHTSKVKEENDAMLKHYLENSCCNTKNNSRTSGDNDGEVEIIRVLSVSTNGKANVSDDRKLEELPPNREPAANSELVSNQEILEDDCESREDSEDDRSTVIFGEEFQKDTDPEEVFEIEEREFVSKKFNNKEITNRKRQRLKKFKKKSMPGRNLAFIKAKTKVAEGTNNEQETGEKPIQGVNEECLAEICSLVERLHELYRIILQLKKELPRNSELAYHFKRVINAQQENFHREIRESQKTIIKCYEKMLSFYSNTGKVARVISKRTSLRVEDIVNVISRCILIEGQCEADETAVGNHEKALNNVHKKISENLTNPTKTSQTECPLKQQMINSCFSFSNIPSGLLHVNHRPKFTHRPSGQLRTPWTSATVEKTPALSNSWTKEYLPFYSAHQITRKNKPYTRVEQNPLPSPYLRPRGPRLGQLLQREPGQMSPNTLGCFARQFPPKPTESQPANVNVQFSVGSPVDRVGPPYVSRDLNYTTGVFQNENPSAAGTKGISSRVPLVSVISPAVLNAEYNRHPDQMLENGQNSGRLIGVTDGLGSNAHPSVKNLNRPVANSHKQSISSSVTQCPLETILTDSVRSSDHNRPFVKTGELYGRNCSANSMPELENSTSHDVQEILDPTIPQKLTMRNCRLQAGPVLVQEDDCTRKLNSLQSLTEERKRPTESRNLGREDSKSRVYVCAQNNCKSPGIRICKGCQSVIYCSETCQLKHWALKHKRECYQLKALRG